MVAKVFKSGNLFLKLSALFFVILMSVSGIYFYSSLQIAEAYFQQKNQSLNANIAEHISLELKPFLHGALNEDAAGHIMHSMMAVNPSIEVYLLDPDGKILNYVAPYKKVVLDRVDLEPIYRFINNYSEETILGDDPREQGRQKVFSAHQVIEDNQLLGYIYVILASEEYDTAANLLFGNYITRLILVYGFTTLGAALLIGIFLIWLITKNLQVIINTVQRFQKGEMSSRIAIDSGGEISRLAESFNEMADTIVGNIENLKSMENLRRELVGNVSHDLRTPLSVIHGYIETILMKESDLNTEEKSRYLNRALDGTKRLKRLVDELFELSKLEAKQIIPQKEAFFINELLGDVTQKYGLIAEDRKITITSEGLDKPFMVMADIHLIERVLQNLIDNAIKFTPERGKIQLKINQKEEEVEIQVIDTGKGIPQEQIPFVFDRYHIGDKRVSLDHNSTGLGLAIVKRILEIHNTTINLQSVRGKGTTFSFVLPEYSA